MNGLLHHLRLTLRLNFRSKQAIVYGYVVPIFFLLAFGSVFRSSKPPLVHEMGQLLTITILGGACFGLPTGMVAERERGVWRRYRLLPTAIGGILLSAMIGRLVIVLSAGLLQVVLARVMYGTPFPAHPFELSIAFLFVCFAFLGMGLVIAMLAETVPAVQALGQAIFLPMIMIGGVGVPLRTLPPWAQHVAGFLPGRYAVQAMQACINGPGLQRHGFDLIALTIIGLAACLAGAKLFRWDIGQRIAAGARAWVALAVVAWAGVGLAAERGKRMGVPFELRAGDHETALLTRMLPSTEPGHASTHPTSTPAPATGAPLIAQTEPGTGWQALTASDLDAIEYDDVPGDTEVNTPLAHELDHLDDDGKKRLEDFRTKLEDWTPGKDPNLAQRVRYLLSVAAVADLVQDQEEAEIAYVVFEYMKETIPKPQLEKAVGWVILNPNDDKVVVKIPELGIDGESFEEAVRERSVLYGKKLLIRLLGKYKEVR